jgi:hypothetical protein
MLSIGGCTRLRTELLALLPIRLFMGGGDQGQ